MITINCENCGKEFTTHECRKQKFCCSDCWYEYNRKRHEKDNIKICKMCGKEFKAKNKGQKFCSRKCADKHQTTLVGEENPHFKRVKMCCEYCGNTYFDVLSRTKTRRFCSYACFNKYQQSDEHYKECMANVLVKNKNDGKMGAKYTMTKPHKMVLNELDKLGIKYVCEYPVKHYLVDIYLNEYDLMIEVNGDYWHSNPVLGYDTKEEVQKKRIRIDKSKRSYIRNHHNIEILYLWETDILHNICMCAELIKKYINQEGALENYQSFNYKLDENNNLLLNDNIILAPIEA